MRYHDLTQVSVSPPEDINSAVAFLRQEQASIHAILGQVRSARIIADFSIISIPFVLKWLLEKAMVSRYRSETRELIMHSAYYMGESFVRSTHVMSWQIKDNVPVILEKERNFILSPIHEVDELFKRISGLLSDENDAQKKWKHDNIDTLLINWLIEL